MLGNSSKSAVVLVSGGLDSAVVLASAADQGYRSFALTVDYGQRHNVELEAAVRIARKTGALEHKILEVDLRAFGGSALTGDVEVPKAPRSCDSEPIPVTYVPARNTIFLSLALAWAEALGSRDIFIGVSSVDYSGYPDCRPEFIEQFERLANLATRAAAGGDPFSVHAPLLKLSKGDTVRMGVRLGVDFGSTWSCYDPNRDGSPCTRCESCRLRAKGFAEAGVIDPLAGR